MSAAKSPGDGSMLPSTASFPEPAARVVELATHYLERVARGEEPDVEITAGSLPEECLREQFRRLIADARSVQDLLPVQVRPGIVLSDRYRIGPEIGSGGMGRVYEAFDRQLERIVAIKVLATPGATSFNAQRQFRSEAVLLAGLQHPNIVAVHEIAEEGDVNYIVMDLVKGTPIDEVLRRAREIVKHAGTSAGRRPGLLREALGAPLGQTDPGPLDESSWHRAVARIVREAARTAEAAHAAGVVHRDIKPKNVLLRSNGTPVLLDFGLAGASQPGLADSTQGLFGTTSYLAPEQAGSGRVGNDPRSDVYQLGVLLHEMLSLSRPFEGAGPVETMRKISRGDFKSPRDYDAAVPLDLEAICLKAMEVDPSRRYQTARALFEDLDRWLGGVELPIAARGGRWARLVRGSRYGVRRHKVAAAAGAALLLGALTGALLWMGDDTGGREIKSFCLRKSTGETVFDPGIVSVSPGDQLGVAIETDEPLYVYVLSVSGQPDPPTWVAPMALLLNDFKPGSQDGAKPTYHSFLGLQERAALIPAGRTEIYCAKIEGYDPTIPFEGLWVFTSTAPHATIESWFDSLDAATQDSENGMVSYAEALKLLACGGPVTRGGSPPRPSPQQARAMADSLAAAMLRDTNDWPFDDPRRWSAVWPVRP